MSKRLTWMAVLCMACGGCGVPPSVMLLMNRVDRVLEEEQALLEQDMQRQTEWLARQRKSLQAGFEADLAAKPDADSDWLAEHTAAYTSARQVLDRNADKLLKSIRQRRSNLQLASSAQQRAIDLLQSHNTFWKDDRIWRQEIPVSERGGNNR